MIAGDKEKIEQAIEIYWQQSPLPPNVNRSECDESDLNVVYLYDEFGNLLATVNLSTEEVEFESEE